MTTKIRKNQGKERERYEMYIAGSYTSIFSYFLLLPSVDQECKLYGTSLYGNEIVFLAPAIQQEVTFTFYYDDKYRDSWRSGDVQSTMKLG